MSTVSEMQNWNKSPFFWSFIHARSKKGWNTTNIWISVTHVYHLWKVMSHAFGKSSSWLNRGEYAICSERPAWSIQLISFDINCLLSVGLGPGKKLNFEWYKQIVLHGFQSLWLRAKSCIHKMCAAPTWLTRWTLWFDLLSCCHLLCLIHGAASCVRYL